MQSIVRCLNNGTERNIPAAVNVIFIVVWTVVVNNQDQIFYIETSSAH